MCLYFTFTDRQFYDISLNVNPGVLSYISVKSYLMQCAVSMKKVTKLAACRRGATDSYFKNLQCAMFKKLKVVVITIENIFSPDYLFDHTVIKFESRCVRYQETRTEKLDL